MKTIFDILTHIKTYVGALDWPYILTFILICYVINHYKVKQKIRRITGLYTRTRYRVIITGLAYGVAIYFIRGYCLNQAEILFQSFIFALVFHKFIVEAFVYYLVRNFLPLSIGKHLVDFKHINK